MLYIVYGLTVDVSRFSRAYFDELGIKRVDKFTYETENVRVKPTDGVLNTVKSEEEVRSCDYVYENHGRVVGFTSASIENAVNGKDDAILTFSSDNLSFLREIKNAYGDHVAIIFTYIDDRTLKDITDGIGAPDSQKIERLKMGQAIKDRFIAERELFDETIIYGGENSLFNLESLKKQYDHIIKKYKNLEKELVPLPYTGNKPYIFVSYARDDTDKVLPYLKLLQRNGCRIWYDKGIKGGDNWMTTLAMKIKNCSQYLLFSSEISTKSVWTRREASRALQYPDINIITVRMDDALFDEGVEWGLQEYQQLFIRKEDFEKNLLESISDDVIERIGEK